MSDIASQSAVDHGAVEHESKVPDLIAARSWLSSEAVAPDGSVWSWRNPAHPGYVYPEAAGLFLTLAAQHRAFGKRQRDLVAKRLEFDASASGGVGRGGVDYTFDTGIVLHGLLAHTGAGGAMSSPSSIDRMFEFVASGIEARRAVAHEGIASHWSTSFTCHQLKLAVVLSAYGRASGEMCRVRELAERLATDLLPLSKGGRFVSNAERGLTYLHAHCYAMEGLLGLLDLGFDVERQLSESAEWLVGVQAPDGTLPAWHDGRTGRERCASDVVAQAVRLWSALDAGRYATPIARSVQRLATLQTPSGGIRYASNSTDVNTWCTIFADQAARWATAGRGGEWLA